MNERTAAGLALAAGVAMALVMGTAAGAAEATFDASLWSKYIWRGQLYTDDPVLQPSLAVSTDFGLGFNAWMNVDLTNANADPGDATGGHPNEIDFSIRYELPLKGLLRAEAGMGTYVISGPTGANGTTADACLKLGLDLAAVGDSWVAALPSPTLAAYYEFLEIEDFYFGFGLEKPVELWDKVSLTLGASIGYGLKDYNAFFFDASDSAPEDGGYAGADEDAFNDINVFAELSWQVAAKVSLSLLAQYTALVEDPVKSSAALRFGDNAWLIGGMKASWAF